MLTLDNSKEITTKQLFGNTFTGANQTLTGITLDTSKIISLALIYVAFPSSIPPVHTINWTIYEADNQAMTGATEVKITSFLGGKIVTDFNNAGAVVIRTGPFPQNGVFGTKRYIQVRGTSGPTFLSFGPNQEYGVFGIIKNDSF